MTRFNAVPSRAIDFEVSQVQTQQGGFPIVSSNPALKRGQPSFGPEFEVLAKKDTVCRDSVILVAREHSLHSW